MHYSNNMATVLSAAMLALAPLGITHIHSLVLLLLEFVTGKGHRSFDGKTYNRKYMPQKQV